jgi:hypothetical protein
MIDKKLLEILACPLCKMKVELVGERLVCAKCGRKYPVRDGIPVMLIEAAEPPHNDKDRSEENRRKR